MTTPPLSPPSVPDSSPSTLRTAWLVVALLWPVALLNYLDRQMLAAMRTSVVTDIPTLQSLESWGLILASFKWVYAGLSPIGGYIADRFNRRVVITTSLFVWSAVTWATGNVQTYEQMLATRAIMGISEAFYIPAALALIADFHTGPTRSRAVGIHQMAIYAGLILGGYSGYVAEDPDLGWRWAFSAAGIVGVIYSVPLLFLLRDPPRDVLGHTTRPSPFSAIQQLLTNPSFILLVLYFTLPAIAGWVVKDWMPAILQDKFHIGQGKAGVSASLYYNVASFFAAVLGGWMADRWMRRSIRGRIYVSAIGMSFIIPAMFGVGFSSTLFGAVAALVLFGIGWGFFDCNNMPILSQIVRSDLRATGYGVMNLVSISCGGFADWGFGKLRDQNVGVEVIFGAFASIALLSVVLVLLIRPRESLVQD